LARSEPTPQRLSPAPAPQAEAPSEIERRILDFMVQYLRANTYQPSIREIGRRFAIKSTKTVSEHLQALADKGFLERDGSRSRGVRILGVDLSTDSVAVPCFHEVPADLLTVHSSGELPTVSVDRRLGGVEGAYFLRAAGDDLTSLGVEAGDLVLIAPATVETVEDGAVVVVRTGGETVFHRFRREGRRVVLEAVSNGAERVVVDDATELSLLGRVSGFFRTLDEAGVPALTRH